MPEIMLKVILGIMLLATSVQDMLQKKIGLWIIALSAFITGVCLVFIRPASLWDCIGGTLVGAAVIFISRITGGKIGMGDGLLLCVTGLGLGFWRNMELFAYALFAAAVVSVILLILRLADRKKSIPFVPFLLLSYLFLTVA